MLNLLLQDTPIDSTPYLLLGYVIIGSVGLIYTLSLYFRQRKLKRDLEVLLRLQQDED